MPCAMEQLQWSNSWDQAASRLQCVRHVCCHTAIYWLASVFHQMLRSKPSLHTLQRGCMLEGQHAACNTQNGTCRHRDGRGCEVSQQLLQAGQHRRQLLYCLSKLLSAAYCAICRRGP